MCSDSTSNSACKLLGCCCRCFRDFGSRASLPLAAGNPEQQILLQTWRLQVSCVRHGRSHAGCKPSCASWHVALTVCDSQAQRSSTSTLHGGQTSPSGQQTWSHLCPQARDVPHGLSQDGIGSSHFVRGCSSFVLPQGHVSSSRGSRGQAAGSLSRAWQPFWQVCLPHANGASQA